MEKIKRTLGFIISHPFASRHRIKSFFQLLLWQLQSGVRSSSFFVKPFIKPIKFYAHKGLTGITGNIYAGLHEFNEMGFLLHFLREDDGFLDIGANVGSYTLLAAGICNANTIAVEASGPTYDLLIKNVALNKLQPKVSAINAAAGSKTGFLQFSIGEDTTNHVIAQDELNPQTAIVKTVTIDALVKDIFPVLVKIDVEGYETEVISGMNSCLQNTTLKAIIIELNGSGARYGFDEKKIHDHLLHQGFRPYVYDPFHRSLKEVDSYGTYNTIYCRDLQFVLQRLEAANQFKIWGESI